MQGGAAQRSEGRLKRAGLSPEPRRRPPSEPFAPDGALEWIWAGVLVHAGLLGVGFGLIGTGLLILWLGGVPASLTTLGWLPVQAQVLQAASDTCAPRARHHFHLELTYSHQGQRYAAWGSSAPDTRQDGPHPSPRQAGTRPGRARPSGHPGHFQLYRDCGAAEMARLVGTVQPAWVNPADPSSVVLHRGIPWPQWAAWCLTRAALLLGLARGMLALVPGLRRLRL